MTARGLGENLPHDARAIWRRLVPVWVALMILLTLTLTLAYVPLHGWNGAVSLVIAATKAGLVGLFFMNLWRPNPLLRLAGSAALLWLVFMFALTFADLLTRQPPDQPGTVTPRTLDGPPSPTGRPAF
jgi:cytochrome c oxidase subunit IV